MGKIIETVCLFRKKEDDIWAVFILEFFKMIGCITSDNILPAHEDKIDTSLSKKCDVTILWNLQSENISLKESIIISAKETENQQKTFDYFRNTGKQIFNEQILCKIWKDTETLKKILTLLDSYAKNDLFFYAYNRGSLKFVQEYYPLKNTEKNNIAKRKETYQITFQKYQNCCEDVIFDKDNSFYHYKFALIYLHHELNCIGELIFGKFIIYAKDLLNQINKLASEYPDNIRIKYLQATICETDNLFLWDAEVYYVNAIFKFERKYPEIKKMGYFLYYKLGKYYEKKRKNIEKAETYYQKAVDCNSKEFRSLYKIGKIEEKKKNYIKAMEAANNIIKNVLNGYEIQNLMPKQQIYIYKSYVLLGDIFSNQGFYSHATLAYKRALKIPDNISFFFNTFDECNEDSKNLKDIIKSCMNKQAVYRKMINVAAKISNMELINECLVGVNQRE